MDLTFLSYDRSIAGPGALRAAVEPRGCAAPHVSRGLDFWLHLWLVASAVCVLIAIVQILRHR